MLARMIDRLGEALDPGTERLKFGLWGVGVLFVFLFHVAALLEAAVGGEHGALVWSILLLIAAPVSVVGLVAMGFARSGGRSGDRIREDTGDRGSESSVDRGREKTR